MSGYGRQYFNALFKARTGMTPQQFIIKTKLNHVRFLRDSGEETALAIVGFTDQSHYLKMLKNMAVISG
jgi:methylphosphotriester-DNA--protein-cysteine methyltransferase